MLHERVRTPVRLVLPVVLLVATAPLAAQESQTQPAQQQREHTVKRGDTLWDLAKFYLGNPFLWPSIFDANRKVVENAHWIYPREVLIIPPILAQEPPTPLGQTPVIASPATSIPTTSPEPSRPVEEPARAPVVIDLRRPVVPWAEYVAVPWVSNTAEREVVGRVVDTVDPEADTDKLAATLHPTDHVFIGELAGSANVGDTLIVVRFGRGVGGRGRVVEPVAILRVDSISSTVLKARIARQLADARVGDLVLPLGTVPQIGMGEPAAVANGVEGELIEFHMEEPLHGTTDLAFISLGSRDGVGIGDELAVYVPPRESGSTQLPVTSIATVRVVKVGDNVATVRVLAVNSTALRDGLPVRLIRKMP